jgi:hypothetical protein
MGAKAAAKPAAGKKGSKLDSLKSLFMGGAKKSAAAKPAAAPAKKAAPAKAPAAPAKAAASKAAPAKAAGKGAPAPSKVEAPAKGKGAAPAAAVKAGANGAKPAAKAGAPAKAAKAPKQSRIDTEAVCREVACENLATTGGYCRMHYIKNWKKIQRKGLILREKKLNQYIEELVAKYPDKYIEAIRQDLANDKDFAKVIHDLDLDESVDEFDVEGDNDDNLIDNIKREFDDEGESF